ncbi:Cyanovirin-N family protein [Penicillium coprophilum]|uniref:Cyanovirin-N family protein n=1 Tax=Penicillium coprophilum TaxID=36646 RepID=UPI0023A63D71|nr:Cyanovirin-N family protein [Penicillium coprophilum]KAJ5154837.1 Cyanovirin-N family protein [Penicillium coprophilum]
MFHKTSMNIKLKDKHILTAYCQRPSGEARYSELDLDQFLGAKKGQFTWGDQGFSKSSRDVVFKLEGPDNEPMLHAQFDDGEGHIKDSQVNLGHCIKNEDGHLSFMECF